MSNIRTLFSQTAIYGLSSIVGRFVNYLLVPLYTNIFNPSEYGIITELYAYSSFLLIIFTYGMETAYFRFVQIEDYKNKVYPTSLFSILCSSIIFLLIFAILIPFIANWLNYNNNSYLLWLLLLILISDSLLAIPFAQLRQQNKAWKFVFLRLTNIFINVLANIIFLIIFPYLTNKGYNLNCIYNKSIGVGYVFISNLIANILTLILISPSFFIKYNVDLSLLKNMLKYSLPLLVAGLAGMVNETFDRVMLKHLVTDKQNAMFQLGIYGANYKISILMTLFIQTFRFAAEPFFFNKYKDKDAKETYASVMKYFVWFGLFIFLFVNLYIHFIQYFIGEPFRVGLKIVPILLLANLFLGIFYNLSVWYKLKNLTIYGAALTIIGAIITILFNFILIPIIGYVGAAWTTFICYFSITILSYFWSKKHYPINYPLKDITFYFVIAVLIFVVSSKINIQSILLKTSINTIILALFVFISFLKERKNLKQLKL
jgi:O-antigen/teichoic acid export membrane protein